MAGWPRTDGQCELDRAVRNCNNYRAAIVSTAAMLAG